MSNFVPQLADETPNATEYIAHHLTFLTNHTPQGLLDLSVVNLDSVVISVPAGCSVAAEDSTGTAAALLKDISVGDEVYVQSADISATVVVARGVMDESTFNDD